jgi:hypothetical protein
MVLAIVFAIPSCAKNIKETAFMALLCLAGAGAAAVVGIIAAIWDE